MKISKLFNRTLWVLISALALSCQGQQANNEQKEEASAVHNKLTEEEREKGWQLLFDGEITEGWKVYGTDTIGSAWKVQDGALFLDVEQKNDWQTIGGGDIVTEDEYESFHLKLEWKISPGGNSGIIFLVHEDTEKYTYPWQTGPEMQILDDEAHPDAQHIKHKAGDLYDLIASSESAVRPAGEWNQAAIILEGNQLEFYLNGVNVVSTTLWDESWNKLVAGSKFSEMAGFARYRKGKICLQDHGDKVWFRNIKIRRL
jgi:hypothetical protein